ncbi:hypothetical protein [Granulibacter bethesdensis]|uniref:hypothetical protein n=1 Tax=Granulibacter bethesdensis TaxID=364410 RepID=UPI0004B5D46A|nr:hypothetical protein [Granulibacter bethesdensis]
MMTSLFFACATDAPPHGSGAKGWPEAHMLRAMGMRWERGGGGADGHVPDGLPR